jgi:hypothetical protein
VTDGFRSQSRAFIAHLAPWSKTLPGRACDLETVVPLEKTLPS